MHPMPFDAARKLAGALVPLARFDATAHERDALDALNGLVFSHLSNPAGNPLPQRLQVWMDRRIAELTALADDHREAA